MPTTLLAVAAMGIFAADHAVATVLGVAGLKKLRSGPAVLVDATGSDYG